MLASKAKSSLSESSNDKEPSNRKATPSAPRVSKLIKTGSSKPERAPSPQHNARIPLDKSSSSIDIKPAGERRSFKAAPRASTPADKQSRILKPSELQAQLNLVQEDLKNAREHLASIEKEKAQVLEDLTLAKRLADEAFGKLEESLAAQKSAEEALELEKFRSVEWEQSSIESAQKKEEEWKRKFENIKKRHTEDVAALVSTTRELEKVKDELARTVEAKNSAVNHAEEVQKIADANAKKVEILMAEVGRLKTLLDSELENKAKEAAEIIKKLESEASVLKVELENAKAFEEKLVKAEQIVGGLKVDVAHAKRAEADANQSAEEWKMKSESLEFRLEEVSRSNKSNEESLASLTKSFEDCTSMLQDRQSEVVQLKEKVASLENEVSGYKEGFLETSRRLDVVQKEASALQATIDRLKSEHQMLHEAHQKVVSHEETASSQIGVLSEDKSKLLRELDGTKEERDKVKKAVEDLAAALREVASEAREAKERVLVKQAELDSAQSQITELKAAMKNAEDRYQTMLDASNYETACLRKTVERLGSEAKSSKDEWLSKEAGFASSLKKSEDELNAIKSDMSKLIESLKGAENEVQELKDEKTQLQNKLKQVESKMTKASSTAEEAKTETSRLKDLLSNKEKELLALNQEVTDLRLRETAALAKVEELSKSLTEATAKKAEEEEAARSTEKSKILLIKHEMDKVLESLRGAEREAQAAKEDKAQLQHKLRRVESKITETDLTAEEAKINSLRLNEMLADKENELQSITRENDDLRAREAAALAKIDELSSLLAEATARKVEPNGVVRSPEKPKMLLKLICSPMDNVRKDEQETPRLEVPTPKLDEPHKNDKNIEVEEVKYVEVETVKVNHVEETAAEANILENSKIIENDLSKEREHDIDSIDDDIESNIEDSFLDQTNGLLNYGPTSSFSQQHNQKKKKALLKKFGSLLKKKAHFTKMSHHS